MLFTPDFLHAAPHYRASVQACALAMMVLGAGFGLVAATLAGLHPGTMILPTPPAVSPK